MNYCPNCGNEVFEGYDFCPECGRPISHHSNAGDASAYSVKFKTCRNCGAQMPEDAYYCLSCGMTFDSQEIEFDDVKRRILNTGKPPKRAVDTSVGVWKNKWVALVLCVLFGVFGIHRFYEEKKISGFIYLFTFGFLGLGVFFDIILIATKPNPYRVK